MATVELKNITKVYEGNVKAVDNANLTINDKEFVVLVGPSGCGKTTTLRMVAGLEEITSGELYIDGKLMNDVAPEGDRGAVNDVQQQLDDLQAAVGQQAPDSSQKLDTLEAALDKLRQQ